MSDFFIALRSTLLHEGGFSDVVQDAGGATKNGISLRFLESLPLVEGDVDGSGHVDRADVIALTPEHVSGFYRRHFWDHYRIGQIKHQRLASKAFDLFVNMRGRTAARVLQRAANELGANLVVDGVAGSKTFQALNDLNTDQVMTETKHHAWQVYKQIIKNDPEQSVFRRGWQKRAFSG